jgi:hypothetical protein
MAVGLIGSVKWSETVVRGTAPLADSYSFRIKFPTTNHSSLSVFVMQLINAKIDVQRNK